LSGVSKKQLSCTDMARVLIALGLILLALGLVWLAFPKALSWFGRLPGDINIQRENTKVFIPVTSMILVSVLLTVVSNLVSWWTRK
jgi:Protein of unknown function (DUF2905)